jgi:hypothetical protein
MTSRSERRKFAIKREQEHLERQRDFQKQPPPYLSAGDGYYQCKNCKGG